MAARGRPQLTKEQIHEAVSLVNECLSDQQMREGLLGPLSPYDTRHFSFSPLNSIQSPAKINSTENLLENADRIFSDAVFTPTVCIHTSKLDVLDDVIAKLASGEIPLSRCELNSTSEQSTEHDELESGVAGSNPSHDDSQQPITSCSDVDSGIDGSALAGSTSSEVKHKLATLDSTAPFSGSDLDPASPSLDTNVPERLDGILEEKNLLRETPEERKVREEIELMEKRLEELQEKQVGNDCIAEMRLLFKKYFCCFIPFMFFDFFMFGCAWEICMQGALWGNRIHEILCGHLINWPFC